MLKQLDLKAKHFAFTDFLDPDNCVIAKAYFEATGKKSTVCVNSLQDEEKENLHFIYSYGLGKFLADRIRAKTANSEDVIRTIYFKTS